MTKKKVTEETVEPKYSIIPKWSTELVEIGATDLNISFNTVTKKSYVDFFDMEGRLWQVAEDDCVIVRNFPDDDDMEYFERIRKQAEEHRKTEKKVRVEDVRDVA